MTGLVEEIQAKVLDNNISTVALLRMVKLAAVKLSLDDAVEWVDFELKGYPDDASVPEYRHSVGELKSHSRYHGPQSVGGDPDTIRKLSERVVHEPISKVIALAGDGTGELISKLPMEVINAVNEANGSRHLDYWVHIPVAFFTDIQEQVRNLILDWAVALERQGILGEGVSFTVEEKKRAAEVATTISIGTMNGSLHNGDVTGNQNRSMVNSSDNSLNSISSENVFAQLSQAVDASVVNQNDRDAMMDIIRAMEKSQGTTEYVPLFQKLVGYLADYVTILGPFLPVLSQLAT